MEAGDTAAQPPADADAGEPLQCTLRPGEALYFPSGWWHTTLNLDQSVFVSAFVNERAAPAAAELRRR